MLVTHINTFFFGRGMTKEQKCKVYQYDLHFHGSCGCSKYLNTCKMCCAHSNYFLLNKNLKELVKTLLVLKAMFYHAMGHNNFSFILVSINMNVKFLLLNAVIKVEKLKVLGFNHHGVSSWAVKENSCFLKLNHTT